MSNEFTNSQALINLVSDTQTPAPLGHFPTALEPLKNISRALDISLFIKWDDHTGVEFGGN